MARKSKDAAQPDLESMTYEQATEELERLTERIEQGEVGLEESLALQRRGNALIRHCRAVLDKAEQELKQIAAEEAADEPEAEQERSGG